VKQGAYNIIDCHKKTARRLVFSFMWLYMTLS